MSISSDTSHELRRKRRCSPFYYETIPCLLKAIGDSEESVIDTIMLAIQSARCEKDDDLLLTLLALTWSLASTQTSTFFWSSLSTGVRNCRLDRLARPCGHQRLQLSSKAGSGAVSEPRGSCLVTLWTTNCSQMQDANTVDRCRSLAAHLHPASDVAFSPAFFKVIPSWCAPWLRDTSTRPQGTSPCIETVYASCSGKWMRSIWR